MSPWKSILRRVLAANVKQGHGFTLMHVNNISLSLPDRARPEPLLEAEKSADPVSTL